MSMKPFFAKNERITNIFALLSNLKFVPTY